MKRKNLHLWAVEVIILVLILSCSKNTGSNSLYIPTSADATSGATLDELSQGRTLYIANCNSCHNLYSPDSYSPTDWESIIANMGPRTGMTPPEIVLVSKYVTRGH